MVYYDGGSAPSEAVKGLRKLVQFDKVNVTIGPVETAAVLAMASINEQEKVLMAANSGHKKTTRTGNKLLLRFQPVPFMYAGAYAEYVLK